MYFTAAIGSTGRNIQDPIYAFLKILKTRISIFEYSDVCFPALEGSIIKILQRSILKIKQNKGEDYIEIRVLEEKQILLTST